MITKLNTRLFFQNSLAVLQHDLTVIKKSRNELGIFMHKLTKEVYWTRVISCKLLIEISKHLQVIAETGRLSKFSYESQTKYTRGYKWQTLD